MKQYVALMTGCWQNVHRKCREKQLDLLCRKDGSDFIIYLFIITVNLRTRCNLFEGSLDQIYEAEVTGRWCLNTTVV